MNWPKSQRDVLRDYWRKACEYDGINPRDTFAVFSPHNPHALTYSLLMRYYLRSKRQSSLVASQAYAAIRYKLLAQNMRRLQKGY